MAPNEIVIETGDIATDGYREDAISVVTNYGGDQRNISVHAGNITTSGVAAAGVRADAYAGSIGIDVGDVSTSGYGADAIAATTWDGDVTIEAGAVSTYGTGGRGVVAYSGGTTSVVVDTVTTNGVGTSSEFDAGGIKAVGAAVKVQAGLVSTYGDYSVGIYANSNHVHDNGQSNHDISVEAGFVATSGLGSDGIHVLNSNENGNVSIQANHVGTRGDYATGVYARTDISGDVIVNAGSVSTYGFASDGIDALNVGDGKVIVNADSVYTSGAHSSGIFVAGYGDLEVAAGSVTTRGYGSTAINARGYGGDIAIAAGTVNTTGDSAVGIHATNFSAEGATLIHADSVTTKRDYSVGVQAEGYGSIDVEVGSVSTNGFVSDGINAFSVNGDVSVRANDVVTHGDSAFGVRASTYTAGKSLLLEVGSVTVHGDDLVGVYASGSGPTQVTVANITATGNHVAAMEGLFSGSYSGPDVPLDVAEVNLGSITTTGNGGRGILIGAQNVDLRLKVDSVETSGGRSGGGFSEAISLFNLFGNIDVVAGDIRTSGDGGTGLSATVFGGDLNVLTLHSITTTGDHASGLLTFTLDGDQKLENSAAITTNGYNSSAINALAMNGDLQIASNGLIETNGDRSDGVIGLVLDGNASVQIRSIKTTGAGSDGLIVQTVQSDPYADFERGVQIVTGSVHVSGEGSRGIYADSFGSLAADVGETNSETAQAIVLRANENASLNVRGRTSSNATEAISITGSSVDVTVRAGGSIEGKTDGIVLAAVNPQSLQADTFYAPTGVARVVNNGIIAGGTGYAVVVSSGQAELTNAGRLVGAVSFAGGDDRIDNQGQFEIGKDSDFGAGLDQFTNTGTVLFREGGSNSIRFVGLEVFDNVGGKIDLRNGRVGDTFSLDGDYEGSGAASLVLEVSGTAADRFLVAGAATGKTTVNVTGVAAAARLIDGDGLTIIRAGANSNAGAFVLGNSDVGLIHYGLHYDPADQSYSLKSSAGTVVYRAAQIGAGVRELWHTAADPANDHMALARTSEQAKSRLWGRASASFIDRDVVRIIGEPDTPERIDVGYRQSVRGFHLGYDFAALGDFEWGLLAHYAASKFAYQDSTDKSNFRAIGLGGYAQYRHGDFFASAILNHDWVNIKAKSEEAGFSRRLSGSSTGVELQAGLSWSVGGLTFEPTAGLAWVKVDVPELRVLEQTISLETAASIRGKVGARFGGEANLGESRKLGFYGSAALLHEFGSPDTTTLLSGGVSDRVTDRNGPTWGEGTMSLELRTGSRFSTSLQGKVQVGQQYFGLGASLGISLRL